MGSAAVLLRKPIAKLEIANDLDSRVVAFFRVLRERPEELVHAIRLTPWHEQEYRQSLETAANDLEEARRLFISSWASIRGGPFPAPGDFRWQKTQTRRSAAVRDVADLSHLLAAAERLRNVQFLHRDGLDVIRKVLATECLLYVDPPYLPETRTRKQGYKHEPEGPAWHRRLAQLLHEHSGPVLLAGYASGLYAELYEAANWSRVERPQRTNSGGEAVECLWLSPLTQEQLAAARASRQKDR
jgi:DNA adenine methylase